jgi:hypothetical protein
LPLHMPKPTRTAWHLWSPQNAILYRGGSVMHCCTLDAQKDYCQRDLGRGSGLWIFKAEPPPKNENWVSRVWLSKAIYDPTDREVGHLRVVTHAHLLNLCMAVTSGEAA